MAGAMKPDGKRRPPKNLNKPAKAESGSLEVLCFSPFSSHKSRGGYYLETAFYAVEEGWIHHILFTISA